MSERRAFEAAIAADRYDGVTRKVFADWLDEHDDPEEADRQRLWTPKWQRAEDWLRDFAEKISGCDPDSGVPDKVTLEQVVEAGRRWVEDGESSLLGGDGFGATILMFEGAACKEFWEHWQEYTRTEVDESKKRDSPFRCCY